MHVVWYLRGRDVRGCRSTGVRRGVGVVLHAAPVRILLLLEGVGDEIRRGRNPGSHRVGVERNVVVRGSEWLMSVGVAAERDAKAR